MLLETVNNSVLYCILCIPKLVLNLFALIGFFTAAAWVAFIPFGAVSGTLYILGLMNELQFWVAFGWWEMLMTPIVFAVEVYYVFFKKKKKQ